MRSRLTVAGEAVQPLFLMFPLGLFGLAIICDLASLLGAPRILATTGYCTLVAGLVGGASALTVVWFEAASARPAADARAGFLGILLDLGVLVVFTVIVMVRLRSPDRRLDPGVLAVEVLGLTLAVQSCRYAGRFGGRRPVAGGRPGSAVRPG
jgi:uncharacterized membrane protein